jgi:hypothetical protein
LAHPKQQTTKAPSQQLEMMTIFLLTILALLGVRQSVAQDVDYGIAVGYQWADGFSSCDGEDDVIFQTVTLPGVQAANLGIGKDTWMAGDENMVLNGMPQARRLRLRLLQAIVDSEKAEQVIAEQIMDRLKFAKFSCIKSDGVTVFLSQDTSGGKRDLGEGEQAVEQEAKVEGTEEGERGQRLLHSCKYHECQADCWCKHGTPYYCQFNC